MTKFFNKEEKMELRTEARDLMLHNFEMSGKRYIPPDWRHYRHQWLWDSCFHAIICAELGLTDLAKNEIEKLLEHQREDGWIPHMIYHGFFKRWDFERRFYNSLHNRFFSSITQPAVLAQAVEAIDDPEWTKKILSKIIRFYLYFKEKQDPDGDYLISIFHPCESGRDFSPEFDFFRWRVPRPLKFLKPFKFLTPALGYLSLLNLERRYRKLGWNIEKIWQADFFNVEDLMFHCIWVDGLRSLVRLMRKTGEDLQEIKQIEELADRAENSVYNLCWDEKSKIFYSLDSKNQKIGPHLTISNLFPLILDNISPKMLEGIISHLKNHKEFWTAYPVPSVAVSHPEFNSSSSWLLWRGQVWINANWFLLQGLVKHGYNEIAKEIAERTKDMVSREGFWEMYSPFTGKGMRVKNFGWSALVVTFDKILQWRLKAQI